MSVRTAQGTVAWMVSLNAVPGVAVPAYWMFGRTKFQGYVVGRCDEDSRLHHELEPMRSLVHPCRVALPPGERHVGAIERLAKMPIEAGVSIHRYRAGFLRAKAFLVDDLATGISTANLDNRSFRLNFEITAWVMDQEFAVQAEQMFRHDFAHARTMTHAQLDDKPWWFRVFSRAAYLTAPVL